MCSNIRDAVLKSFQGIYLFKCHNDHFLKKMFPLQKYWIQLSLCLPKYRSRFNLCANFQDILPIIIFLEWRMEVTNQCCSWFEIAAWMVMPYCDIFLNFQALWSKPIFWEAYFVNPDLSYWVQNIVYFASKPTLNTILWWSRFII